MSRAERKCVSVIYDQQRITSAEWSEPMLLTNTMNGPKDSTALDKLQALQTSLNMSFPQMHKAHFCSAAQIIDIKPLQKTNQAFVWIGHTRLHPFM